jgi:hypothetical protein
MITPEPSTQPPTRSPSRAELPAGPTGAGTILRLKLGYNPNSSSIGTIVFGMPAALAVLTVAFGTAAGVLCAALLRAKARGRPTEHGAAPVETTAPSNDAPSDAPAAPSSQGSTEP